jgi:hypothetical protein
MVPPDDNSAMPNAHLIKTSKGTFRLFSVRAKRTSERRVIRVMNVTTGRCTDHGTTEEALAAIGAEGFENPHVQELPIPE